MYINFYHCNDILHKSIASVLLKILEENKKALIYCNNQDLINQIDDGLWSFSKTKFIPHGQKKDDIDIKKQLVFLHNDEENLNNADYLIFLNKVSDDFAKKFDKIFYFFNDLNKEESRSLWKYYKEKNAVLNFYKKEDKNWLKINID